MPTKITIARGNLESKNDLAYGELFLDTVTAGGPYIYVGGAANEKIAINTDAYIESSMREEYLDANTLHNPEIYPDGLILYDNTSHIIQGLTEDLHIHTITTHNSIRAEKVKTTMNSVGLLIITVDPSVSGSVDIFLPESEGARWASGLRPALASGATYQISFVYGVFYCSDKLV